MFFVFGAQRSGKTHLIKNLIINNTIAGNSVIFLCKEPWLCEEQDLFMKKLHNDNKSFTYDIIKNKNDLNVWFNYLDNYTQDITDSKEMTNDMKQKHSLVLVLDDLQDKIEALHSGIEEILQSWRHRNVTVVILNQVFSESQRRILLYSHGSHFILFRMNKVDALYSFVAGLPTLCKTTSLGAHGQPVSKPRHVVKRIYYDACCSPEIKFGHLLVDNHTNQINPIFILRTNADNKNEQLCYHIERDGRNFTVHDTIRVEGKENEHTFRLLNSREQIKKEQYKQGSFRQLFDRYGRKRSSNDSCKRRNNVQQSRKQNRSIAPFRKTECKRLHDASSGNNGRIHRRRTRAPWAKAEVSRTDTSACETTDNESHVTKPPKRVEYDPNENSSSSQSRADNNAVGNESISEEDQSTTSSSDGEYDPRIEYSSSI